MAGPEGVEPPKIGFAGRRPILAIHLGDKPQNARRRTLCLYLGSVKFHLKFLPNFNALRTVFLVLFSFRAK